MILLRFHESLTKHNVSVRSYNVTDTTTAVKCQKCFLNWFHRQPTCSFQTAGGRNEMKGRASDDDKCHTLNHMFLLKLSDRPKEDLWVCGIFVFFLCYAADVPWHSRDQFKHSWPAQGNSSTFIRNAKVTLKMQFINPQQWTVFFILLWKINVIELEGCQHGFLLRSHRTRL